MTSEKRYVYDGMNVIQERDASNVAKVNYTWAGSIGGLLSRTEKGTPDAHFYYHYDGGGNVVQITNAGQSTVVTYSYDAYGRTLSTTGTGTIATQPYRFSTKEFHQASGLYEYGLRFYDPGMGRWLNRDPIGESGGLNLYGFVSNNPVSFVDEYGLSGASFMQGFGDGIADSMMSMAQTIAIGMASGYLMASGSAVIPILTAILGYFGLAAAVIDIINQVRGILNSDLCWDEKHYQLGHLLGSTISSLIAGVGGYKAGGMGGVRGGSPLSPRPKVGGGCFIAGTLVLMADGNLKPIEQLKQGDEVLSRDEKTGKVEKKRVLETRARTVDATLILEFSNGQHIETTTEHPFYVEGKGFVKARELGIGTSIVTRAGPSAKVVKFEAKNEPATVYNLTVDGFHTYFVGKTSIWVHSADDCGGGGEAPPQPPTEIYVIGRQLDTAIAKNWPDHNVLSLPPKTWSPKLNDEWVQSGIDKGAEFYLGSPIEIGTLRTPKGSDFPTTIYFRELKQLRAAGYGRVGNSLFPPR